MKILVLCGGKGARFGEAAKGCQKVLLGMDGIPYSRPTILDVKMRLLAEADIPIEGNTYLLAGFGADGFGDSPYKISAEPEPLGTGGALLYAARMYPEILEDNEGVIITNGDTPIMIDFPAIYRMMVEKNASVIVVDRGKEGNITKTRTGKVANFSEERHYPYANAGLTLLRPQDFALVVDLYSDGNGIRRENNDSLYRRLASIGSLYAYIIGDREFRLGINNPKELEYARRNLRFRASLNH